MSKERRNLGIVGCAVAAALLLQGSAQRGAAGEASTPASGAIVQGVDAETAAERVRWIQVSDRFLAGSIAIVPRRERRAETLIRRESSGHSMLNRLPC